jgi:hypothetical protein
MMVPLFADLSKVLRKTSAPIAKRLQEYSEVQGRMFLTLRNDLMFYLGAVRFIKALQAHGLPVCRPEIVPADNRLCDVEDSYNAGLALHSIRQKHLPAAIIKNHINADPEWQDHNLTGPNQGARRLTFKGWGCAVAGAGRLLRPLAPRQNQSS